MPQKLAQLLGCLLLLSGCATTYQPYGLTGGYTEQRVGEVTFKVEFLGNGAANAERVSDFCLLRAAELISEAGYAFFELSESKLNEKVLLFGAWDFEKLKAARLVGQHLNLEDEYFNWGIWYMPLPPKATLTAQASRERPESKADPVFVVESVVQSIREKYHLDSSTRQTSANLSGP